ncbi:hypothetical protein [Sphingomonas sp. DT-204]|uniref:hypothetical protein n=1 Tax=Sphingomonas sp. DT-204 TaxID=3396166 RepID=UPI003F1BE4FA
MKAPGKAEVAFLFLGETLLIPHLYPILEELARAVPELPVDAWIATSAHEELLGRWLGELGPTGVRLRRAPGFRALRGYSDGRNPPLPTKLPMLARLAPAIARTPVAVCAEQTSLWLPTLLPLRTRFIKTLHGAGSMSAYSDRRRKSAWLTFVASERERATLASFGVDPARILALGYMKAGFRHRQAAGLRFAEPRPVLLYTPHWQQHRSSWWRWGEEVMRRVIASGRYNLIFAPHQRLVERAPEVRTLCAELAGRDDVHCDLDSFAMVDGSYTAAADIYLGDTSSQVVEFLMRPRPCVFLNAQGAEWRGNSVYDMWQAGEVVDDIDALLPAIDRAPRGHERYAAVQRAFAGEVLGDASGAAPRRAAAQVLAALR